MGKVTGHVARPPRTCSQRLQRAQSLSSLETLESSILLPHKNTKRYMAGW